MCGRHMMIIMIGCCTVEVRHLGNNAVSTASGTAFVHVGRSVNGGGVGDDAISAAPGSSFVVVGGDVSEDDGGEGIHLSLFDIERVV